MNPKYQNGNVIAQCPTTNCNGSLTTFEHIVDGKSLGSVVLNKIVTYKSLTYTRTSWQLFRCASCGAGAMAKIHGNNDFKSGVMESFWPLSGSANPLPPSVPEDIQKEYREAEKCYSVEAYRAASAMVRSVLEKTLKENGYMSDTGGLKKKIELAATDGAITAARAERAQEKIKILGDDVLHDDYRVVSPQEVGESLHYAQRILEDLYDDRAEVVAILTKKNRLGRKPTKQIK
ncbi:MAG: DUF4145 domain-containing protein [Patescibacteria group bacterium]